MEPAERLDEAIQLVLRAGCGSIVHVFRHHGRDVDHGDVVAHDDLVPRA